MKRKGAKEFVVPALGALALLAAAVTALWPSLSPLAARAAMLSAAVTMPEGSLAALRERYRELLEQPSGSPEAVPQASSSSAPEPSEPEPPAVRPAPSSSSAASSETVSEAAPLPEIQPEIPPEHQGELKAEDMRGYEGGPFIRYNSAWLRNYTDYTAEELLEILETPMEMTLGGSAETEPQVLIYHTHATESYAPYDSGVYDKRYNWRSTDNNINMVSVGAVLAETLRQNGIAVVQDTSQHDYPSYDGSYQNSRESIERYLEQYPSIRVVLDLHRDAIEREGGQIVKPTLEADGVKFAQMMIIANCDDGSGLIPRWRENFRFAAALADQLEQNTPGITRPVMVAYRKYNQQLSTGALLLEFGSHANTLEESRRTARLVGEALAELLKNTRK